MSTLSQVIENIINAKIMQYIEELSEKYDLNKQELLDLWNVDGSALADPIPIVLPKVVTTPALVCKYKFTKGASSGQICGCKLQNGNSFCSKHKKFEGVEPKEKACLPKPKKSIVEPVVKTSPKKQPIEVILRKNKAIDKLWHIETGMVFQSAIDRFVIGKCVDDTIHDLTEEDIDICKSMGFIPKVAKDEDENKIMKAVHKITSVDGHDATRIKKSITDVEDILDELQNSEEDEDEDDDVEEEELLEEEN